MDDLYKAKIKIAEISQGATKFGQVVKLIDEKGRKFHFFDTKRDGNPTKAYEQYKQGRFMVGDNVEFAYKGEEKSFTNDKGKNITYKDRKIMFFKEAQAPQQESIEVDRETPF